MNKETRERIQSDAKEFFSNIYDADDSLLPELTIAYISGAEFEYPKAHNEAIDKAIIALINNGFTSQDYNGKIAIDTLKALKLDPNQAWKK